jgi:hypothetical protein
LSRILIRRNSKSAYPIEKWFAMIFGTVRYVEYYNTRRPHQGIANRPPNGESPMTQGPIRHRSLCFGLVHDFYRDVI